MKKLLILCLIFSCFLCGCTKSGTNATVEVKNGFMDISVEDFEEKYNSNIDDDYSKLQLEKGVTDEYSYYFCELEEGIKFSMLATPDDSMIYTIDISCDTSLDNVSAENFGYYYAKLARTVSPDITGSEVSDIAANIGEPTLRNGLIFSSNVDGLKLRFTIIASSMN